MISWIGTQHFTPSLDFGILDIIFSLHHIARRLAEAGRNILHCPHSSSCSFDLIKQGPDLTTCSLAQFIFILALAWNCLRVHLVMHRRQSDSDAVARLMSKSLHHVGLIYYHFVLLLSYEWNFDDFKTCTNSIFSSAPFTLSPQPHNLIVNLTTIPLRTRM